MITTLLATLVTSLAPPAAPPPAPAAACTFQEEDAEFERRHAAAAGDVAKLWELAEWCKDNSRRSEARKIYKEIVDLDPDHEGARKGLGHHSYDGQWFETYTALSKYKREEEARMLEKGLVRHGEGWAPVADVPYMRMRWTKDEAGAWIPPSEARRRELAAEMEAKGWIQHHLDWISPEEREQLEQGLHKCGEEWLPLEQANQYHASLATPWRIVGEHFVIESTCDFYTADWSRWHADQTFADLQRAYGLAPERKPWVTVLRTVSEYNAFATGDQAAQRPPAEIDATSSCHYAFFGEALIDPTVSPPEYRGRGITYWDTTDQNVAAFGPFGVRHAAGHSYAEAIDPSWDAISRVIEASTAGGGAPAATAPFWAEKRVPRWFRFGAASYVERYAKDPQANAGEEWRLRHWAVQNVKDKGGLRPLSEVFAFQLDPTGDQTGKLIGEAGLLVAFVLDGGCEPVTAAHAAFKAALRAGEPTAEAVAALQQAIVGARAELQAFAGLDAIGE